MTVRYLDTLFVASIGALRVRGEAPRPSVQAQGPDH